MASFDLAQKYVKVAEGGYQATVSDEGNYVNGKLIGTNWGISAPVLADYLGREPSVADMKNLTYETALKIYKKDFWDEIGGDSIKNDSVAIVVYDGAVNQGVGALRNIVKSASGASTNLPNKEAIDKVNNYSDQKELFTKIGQARIERYIAGGFGAAWQNRVKNIIYSGVEKVKDNWLPIIFISIGMASVVAGIIYRKHIIKFINAKI